MDVFHCTHVGEIRKRPQLKNPCREQLQGLI